MTNKEIININKNNSVILIDGGYYVFYRYFATFRWFSFKKKTFEIDTITENEEFITSFINHINNDLHKLCKKWKTTNDNIIICMDCPRSNIWRNDIYDKYKSSRTQNINFNSKIFNVFYNFITDNNIKKINFDRLEADDIVFLIQKNIKKYVKDKIVIITNDNDYLQLVDSNIDIFNMQFKNITLRGNQNPKKDLYIKAIYGDKSDNIQKITPLITKELIQNMDEKEIIDWIKNNNLYNKFDFNMNLISFENIPIKYITDFNKKYLFNL